MKNPFSNIFNFDTLRKVLNGELLTKNVLRNNYKLLLLIFILTMVYINNRYLYETQLKRLDSCKKELNEVRLKSLDVKKAINEKSLRSSVKKRLNELNSTIEESYVPPIIIED